MGGLIVRPNWEKLLSNGTHSINPDRSNTCFISWTIQAAHTFEEIVTRDTEIPDLALQGGRDYWFSFRAMPAEEPTFVPPPPFLSNFTSPQTNLMKPLTPRPFNGKTN